MTEPVAPETGELPGSDGHELPAGDRDADPIAPVATEPVVPAGLPGSAARRGRRLAVALGYLGAALVGALLLGGSLVAFGGLGRAAPTPTPSPPPNAVDGPSIGSTAAAVTVEVWADYQCPFCRLETIVFGGAMERAYVLPGIARIVYRDFAFLGQESIDAAVAARCAGRSDPGAYWRYHDLLFASQQGENQGTFKRANLVTLAGIAAVDPAAFTACLDDPAVAKSVADETANGRALGVESTPTLRVSGPGGTQTLAGFSAGWATLRDAITAVSVPPASGSPAPGATSSPAASGATPSAAGATPSAAGATPTSAP